MDVLVYRKDIWHSQSHVAASPVKCMEGRKDDKITQIHRAAKLFIHTGLETSQQPLCKSTFFAGINIYVNNNNKLFTTFNTFCLILEKCFKPAGHSNENNLLALNQDTCFSK